MRAFCEQHFGDSSTGVIEVDPKRELEEEFSDSLGIEVGPEDYTIRQLGLVVPQESESVRIGSEGQSTVRVFNTYEVELTNPDLIRAVLANSETISDSDLLSRAVEKAKAENGKAKETALAVFSYSELESLAASYGQTQSLSGHAIASNVPCIFEIK